MKFTDGYWMLRPGVRASYPAQVLDAAIAPDSMVVHAPGFPVRGRDELLRGPALTVAFGAPLPDVIRVTVTHFAGEDRSPDFPLADTGSGLPQISETDDELTFTSGALTARLAKAGAWSLDFRADGRRLTGSGTKAMAVVDTEAGEHYIREQLDLGVDHFVYGLGERFGPLVKNGQTVDIWNADGGTASEQAYKAVGDTVVVTLG